MNEKILVIHQGALGDVILSFPALRSLRRERDASMALLCKDQVGRMAQESKVVDAHFPVERAHFCGLFSSHMSHDMQGFVSEYDTILLIGFSQEMEGTIKQHYERPVYRITPRPPAEEERHVAVHLIRQLQARGLLRQGEPEIAGTLSSFACLAGDQGKRELPGELVLVHPGAGSKRKRWPLEKFIDVAAATRQMGLTEVAFVIGPAERDLLPHVVRATQGRFSVHYVEDLAQVMALMQASRCFVGNDSGLTHLAAFKGLPTVAVFGPSSPKRWSPIGCNTAVLRSDVDCVPCFELEETNCDHPQCLNGVSVKMVLEAIGSFQTI
ncbi:MAG: glycosyltransferase family 9 protein [Thermodesulfobacteriota bacterium]|nr:glycosyltransferase family 9 protein [Thermodesulfobacteriota bacterium]